MPREESIFVETLAMLDQPLISLDMKRILNKFYDTPSENNEKQIVLNIGDDIGFIKYDLPRSVIESSLLDPLWFSATLF